MYILFELTDTNMVFTLKDEAGADIGTPYTFALATYTLTPHDKLGKYVVRGSEEPLSTWPPKFAISNDCKVVFDNQTTGPFQTVNEGETEF